MSTVVEPEVVPITTETTNENTTTTTASAVESTPETTATTTETATAPAPVEEQTAETTDALNTESAATAPTEEKTAANNEVSATTSTSTPSFTPPPPRPKHVNPQELLERKRREREESNRKRREEGLPEEDDEQNEDEGTEEGKQRGAGAQEHPTEADLEGTNNNIEDRAAATVSGGPTAEELRKQQEEDEELDRRLKQQLEFKTQRTELEAAESTTRSAIVDEEEPNAFQSEIEQPEKADQQAYAQRLRDELNRVEASSDLRRKEAAKLVTALGEIRRHFTIDQERVNLTKQYTDIALKCRLFDEWMNERYIMSSPRVARHDRTGLISLEEMEAMHSQRDELLDELERLADNMAGLRHLVMDADEVVVEDENQQLIENNNNGSQQQAKLIKDRDQQEQNHEGGEKHVGFPKDQQQQNDDNNTEQNLTARTHSTYIAAASVHSRTSATDRADDAIQQQRGLLMKTKELENKKRELQGDISHREKESEVKMQRCNNITKASAAAMSGLNKELFRLEEAVNAHFRVLRTSYQSAITEFPQLFEFDAFTQDAPTSAKKTSTTTTKTSPKAITAGKPSASASASAEHNNNNGQQLQDLESNNSRRSSIHSASNNNNKVGRIANVAHTVSVAQDKAAANKQQQQQSQAEQQKALAAASLAREASRLASPTMQERIHRAAEDSKRQQQDRQKSVVDRAREDASEEARSQRRLERETIKSTEVTGKDKVRQREAEEKAKMLGRKQFMRV